MSLPLFVLLSQHGSRYKHMADRFQPGGNDYDSGTILFVLLVLGLVLLAGVAIWLFEWWRVKWSCKSRYYLFYELCRSHKLSWSQAWTIRRVARQCGLGHPVSLFVIPEVIEHTIRQQQSNPGKAKKLNQLHKKIFGETAGKRNLKIINPLPPPQEDDENI